MDLNFARLETKTLAGETGPARLGGTYSPSQPSFGTSRKTAAKETGRDKDIWQNRDWRETPSRVRMSPMVFRAISTNCPLPCEDGLWPDDKIINI